MEYQLQAVWSIKKESFINAKDDDDEIGSENFKTTLPNDIKYSFVLYRGKKEYSAIWIEIPPNADFKEMKLSIPSANFEADLSNECVNQPKDVDGKWPNTAFIKHEDLLDPEKKFFVNDILTIEFRGVLCYKNENFDLTTFLWKKDDKDFSFIVGNDKIKIHKFILGQFSSVFDLNKNQIKIENFGYIIVRSVVELCYGQKNSFAYNVKCKEEERLFHIIKFTNVYEMPIIKEKAEFKLQEYIKEETVCELANKSIEYKADKLRGYCVNFIANSIKTGKPFDGYTTLHPEIVNEVFKATVCHKDTS